MFLKLNSETDQSINGLHLGGMSLHNYPSRGY